MTLSIEIYQIYTKFCGSFSCKVFDGAFEILFREIETSFSGNEIKTRKLLVHFLLHGNFFVVFGLEKRDKSAPNKFRLALSSF